MPPYMPRDLRIAPELNVDQVCVVPSPKVALLINPFYPKDPHASFGKHVLTPTLALTSIAGGPKTIPVGCGCCTSMAFR